MVFFIDKDALFSRDNLFPINFFTVWCPKTDEPYSCVCFLTKEQNPDARDAARDCMEIYMYVHFVQYIYHQHKPKPMLFHRVFSCGNQNYVTLEENNSKN